MLSVSELLGRLNGHLEASGGSVQLARVKPNGNGKETYEPVDDDGEMMQVVCSFFKRAAGWQTH